MKESQNRRILNLLKSKGEATNFELNHICFRYAARIQELRQDYNIVSVHEEGSRWRYVYKGERQAIAVTPDLKEIDSLLASVESTRKPRRSSNQLTLAL